MSNLEIKVLQLVYLAATIVLLLDMFYWRPF